MKLNIFAVSPRGVMLAKKLSSEMEGTVYTIKKYADADCIPFDKVSDITAELFDSSTHMVYIMAQGIVSRSIAPCLKSKLTDPAIVVCDDSARFVISAAGGHEGGANALCYKISSITGGIPVVTTASESDKVYVIGLGARKGAKSDDVVSAINAACDSVGISLGGIRVISSAWLKKDEEGIAQAASQLGIDLRFIPKFLFDMYKHDGRSIAAAKYFDVPAVAEPSAMMAAHNPSLIMPATVFNGVMVAIAKDNLFMDTDCK